MGEKRIPTVCVILVLSCTQRHMYHSDYEACDLGRQWPRSGFDSLAPLPWWASGRSPWFGHTADCSFFSIDADATHERFEMGVIAAHVTALDLMWTGRGKGTKKHQVTNQRGKTVQRQKQRQQIGNKFKQSETQRSKASRWKNISSSYSRVAVIFYFLCFSTWQLVCNKR